MRCIGLVSKVCCIQIYLLTVATFNLYFRCTALASDLDGEFNNSFERSHEHTEAIDKAFDGNMKSMWEGYGIIGDVAVSYFILYYRDAVYNISHQI